MPRQRFSVSPGDRFGRLQVVEEEFAYRDQKGTNRWAARCACECGTELTVMVQNLKDKTRSCGCMKRKGTMSATFAETRGYNPRLFAVEPGQRFGNLVVVAEFQDRTSEGRLIWKANLLCDCGQPTTATLSNLKNRITRSCGCLQRKKAGEAAKARSTHAASKSEHYPRWHNMMRRCYNPDDRSYRNYGGRGILVCAEWHDAAAFVTYLDQVLGPRPSGHTLDRVDNAKHYEPGNVRWASRLTQRHNQRRGASWGAPRSRRATKES